MMYKAWGGVEEVSNSFSRSKFKAMGDGKSTILTRIGRFRNVKPVWTPRRLQQMLKDLSGIEELAYCFSRSFVKCQAPRAKKSTFLTRIERCFRIVTPVWIYRWLRNVAQHLKCHRRLAHVICCMMSETQYHEHDSVCNTCIKVIYGLFSNALLNYVLILSLFEHLCYYVYH